MKNLGSISPKRLDKIDGLSPDRKRQFYMAHSRVMLELSKQKSQAKNQESMMIVMREKFQEVFRLLDKLEWEEFSERNGL